MLTKFDIRRREAIAVHAAVARLSAAMITEQEIASDLREAAAWMETRFADVESMFLTHADASCGEERQQWLGIAERWLEFYTSELRRLEDRAGLPHLAFQWPHGEGARPR